MDTLTPSTTAVAVRGPGNAHIDDINRETNNITTMHKQQFELASVILTSEILLHTVCMAILENKIVI